MKRVILAIMLLLGLCTTASAQKERLLAYDVALENFAGQFWIDRSAQKFYFDSDSEDDAVMLIKNYKKSGNKETFDIYQASTGSKVGNVELIIYPELTANDDLKKQKLVVLAHGHKQAYGVKTEKQDPKAKSSGDNPIDKAKDGVKNLFNKGKNLIKKKK